MREPATEDHDEIVLEATGPAYTYIGRDAEGYYHHYDGDRETVLVTDEDAETTAVGVLRRFRVHGAVDHVEENVPSHDLDRWTAFVAERRGWDDLSLVVVSLSDADACFDAREEVL